MNSLNTLALECNKQLKINFNGGDLSSDAGLLLIKKFVSKLSFEKLVKSIFKTNDPASYRFHTDSENLWQMVYQILGAYFEDNCADELTNDPVFTTIMAKEHLVSQPTLSRFFNRMDDATLKQFLELQKQMRKVEKPTDQIIHMYTFVVANMDAAPEQVIKFYCKRGLMENFIK